MPGFLDLTETQLISFAQNFALKLAVHEPVLVNITVADVTQAGVNSTNLATAVNTSNNLRQDSQEYTNVKNIILYSPLGTPYPTAPTATAWPATPIGSIAGIIAWYRMMSNRIKADSGATEAILQDLGIVSTPDVPGTDAPVITGRALPGYNDEIDWSKNGHDALRVRAQVGTETTWTDLGTDMNPPFIDNRAPVTSGPPEERRYQGAYVDNDELTTDWSATLTIIAHS